MIISIVMVIIIILIMFVIIFHIKFSWFVIALFSVSWKAFYILRAMMQQLCSDAHIWLCWVNYILFISYIFLYFFIFSYIFLFIFLFIFSEQWCSSFVQMHIYDFVEGIKTFLQTCSTGFYQGFILPKFSLNNRGTLVKKYPFFWKDSLNWWCKKIISGKKNVMKLWLLCYIFINLQHIYLKLL